MNMWLFPYEDDYVICKNGNKRPIGKRVKQCPCCNMLYDNNLPWNAKYCPNCGSRNGGLEK